MQTQPPETHANFIIPLAAAGRNRADEVGGKAGPLGELTQAGFPVPPGFCITAAAYRTIADGDIAAAIRAALDGLDPADAAALDTAADQIAAAFALARIPDDLAAAIIGAYDGLAPDSGEVAVRSSATAEDLPDASFAGQQRTFLDMRGHDAVLEAVRACWAGLWTPQAIAYRHQQGVPQEDVALAVLVQRMVPAEYAGVLFTADPVSGDRGVLVVEAVAGLGERLVEGRARPERVVLETAGLSVRERSTPEEGAAPLPDTLIRDLGTLAVGVEALMGAPQDIEWAAANGKLWVVQARPITTLAEPSVRPLPRPFAEMLLERFPEPPMPLDYDLIITPALGSMALLPGGRLLPPPLREEGGVVVGLKGPLEVLPQLPFRAALMLSGAVASPAAWEREERPAAEAAVRALAAQDLSRLSDAEVVQFVERARAEFVAAFRPRWRAVGSILPAAPVLFGLVRLAVGRNEAVDTAQDLIAGVEHVTVQMNRELADVAAAVRAVPDALRALTEQPPEPAAAWLASSTDPAIASLWARIREVQRRYAGREVGGMSLANPSWGEDPVYVVTAVAALASLPTLPPQDLGPGTWDLGKGGATEAFDFESQSGPTDHFVPSQVAGPRSQPLTAARARARVVDGLARRRLAFLSPLFRWAVERARAVYRLREDSHFVVVGFVPELRRGVLELGRRWTARGLLARPEDIFFLKQDDLRAAAAGALDMRPLVDDRRRRWRAVRRTWAAQMPPPPALTGSGAAAKGALRGTPASRGVVTASVRIIRDQREFNRLRPGEVLVCPYTSPSWTPLFALASAVVTETGGAMSHAAIVAREYGIPAVMGVTGALNVLRDGQRVTVDGGRGLVLPEQDA